MMGAEGTGIFQHDLSAEVRDTFFEYFDKGMDLNQIKQQIGDEFGYESLDGVEKEVYCGAMIHCLWEIGAPNTEFIDQLIGLENQSELEQYWGDDLPRRRAAVTRLLKKVGTPKGKPKKAKGAQPDIKLLFSPGDCVLYQRTNGRYVPLVFWDVERLSGLEYLFAVPNLSRVEDPDVIKRFLSHPDQLTKEEFAQLLSSKQRFKTIAVKNKVMKSFRERFIRFARIDFPPSDWRNSTIGNLAETLECFEQLLNGSGSRSLSQLEIEQMKSDGSLSVGAQTIPVICASKGTS
ncbi:MAG: hypothetical protein ACK578_06600, partial [Pirellula sp.]